MKRRNFLRNVTLAIAASLLPRVLQPSSFDVEEEMVEVEMKTYVVGYDPYKQEYIMDGSTTASTFKISKKNAELIAEYQVKPKG